MLKLAPNTANQRLTLNVQQWLQPIAPYFLMECISRTSLQRRYLVPRLVTTNTRYTILEIDLDVENPTSGSILVDAPEDFTMKVFAQTSPTNLDPTDPTVVGEVVRGTLQVTTPALFNTYVPPPTNIIVYEP